MPFDGFPGGYFRRDGTPYPNTIEGLLEWGKDFENQSLRVVRQDELPNGYWVSTVWLGLNHRYFEPGPPLIFETMIKDPAGNWSNFQERYATEADAIIGHLQAVDEYKDKDYLIEPYDGYERSPWESMSPPKTSDNDE